MEFYLLSALHCFSNFTLAYIDPGTGSIILQAIIGAIAGIAVAARLYWSKVREIFGYGNKKSDTDEEEF